MDPRRRYRWQTKRRQVLRAAGILVAFVFFAIVAGGYVYGWRWTGFPNQTLWNWLELLIIPAALGVGTAWLNSTQRQRERREEDRQTKLERYIQNQRAQDDALQSYLDYMSKLLIDEKLLLGLTPQAERSHAEERTNGTRGKRTGMPLTQEQEYIEQVQVVLRARTLALLSRLEDRRRKVSVLMFLYESGLIARWGLKYSSLIPLAGADLHEIWVEGLEARLDHIDLSYTDLHSSRFSRASLSRAYLIDSDLSEAHLEQTNLEGAYLMRARLLAAQLNRANLTDAYLTRADLRGADLTDADLRGARLSRADLSGAIGTIKEQLLVAKSLKGAMMPNGQKYEDWLNNEAGRGEEEP